jgi:Zn-dependent peptidase ImmA (M78 family)
VSKPRTIIPKRVVFPFGFVVRVEQVSRNVLTQDVDSEWNGDSRSIFIDKGLSLQRRRYLLTHELGHAWLDWQHYIMDLGVGKH